MGAEVKSMEIKKPQQSATSDRSFSIKGIWDFIADIKTEIQKITWTNREELMVYAKIVVGATFMFGMAIYLLDLAIQAALSTLSFLLHFIGG